MTELEGDLHARGRRFAIAVARFNELVTRELLRGALEGLHAHGVAEEDVDVVWVPGAWELPIAARRLLATDRYDALVAVGAVIRGETPHFEYVAGEAARGLALGRIQACDVTIQFTCFSPKPRDATSLARSSPAAGAFSS